MTGSDIGRVDDAGVLVGLDVAVEVGSMVVCFNACVIIDDGRVGRFVGRLIGFFIGFFVGRFVGRFTGRFDGFSGTVSILDSICSSKSILGTISSPPDPS